MKLHIPLLSALLAAAPALAQDAPAGAQESPNRVTNLYDAFGPQKDGVVKDWGYGALVEFKGKRILFDAGNNADVLKKNIEALGIDLNTLDFAVLSHAHADHLTGFDYVFSVNPKLKLYVPQNRHTLSGPDNMRVGGPEQGAELLVDADERYFDGGPTNFVIQPSGRWWGKDVEVLTEDKDLGDGIRLVFTKSPYVGSANGYPPASVEARRFTPLNELSLTLTTEQGEVLIVGCSHSGVENIVKAVRERYNTNVDTLVGGFHLYPYDSNYIQALAKQIKDELGVRQVSPTHCTGHLGIKAFKDLYGDNYHKAGLGTTVPLPGR